MISTLGIFLLLFWVALLIGNFTLRFFRCLFHDRNEELIFSYGLGLIILSGMVLAGGATGHLTSRALWMGMGVLGAGGSLQIPHLFRLFRNREGSNAQDQESRWLQGILWLVIAIIGLRALVPIFDSDALAYHLSFPKDFLSLKRIDTAPHDVNSLFPFFTEMLYTLGLALGNEAAAQLFHWSLGVLLAFSLVNFFYRYFGSRNWGRLSALFLLLTPGIFNEMSKALVDIAWAAYGFLSFYALVVGIPTKQKGWLLIAAIFLGALCGIKYLAVLSVLSTFGIFLFLCFHSGWRGGSISRWALAAGTGMILVSGYWYFQAFRVYGNPVYPYFNSLFGLEPLPITYEHVGKGSGILSLLLLPFNLTFFPARFDGWAEQIGPAYLIFFPFVFWGERTELRLALSLYAGFFTLGWFCLAQATRFLYPILPFLVLLIMSGFYSFYRAGKQTRASFPIRMLFLVFLLNGSLLVYHSREGFPYLAGFESKDAFLEKRERSYGVAKFINENLPPDAKILNLEEPRMFYFKRTLVREPFYRFRTRYDQPGRRDEIVERLKRGGFSHLLIANKIDKKEKFQPKPWADHDSSDQRLERIYQGRFQERNGRERRYTLYRLL